MSCGWSQLPLARLSDGVQATTADAGATYGAGLSQDRVVGIYWDTPRFSGSGGTSVFLDMPLYWNG